MKNKKNILIKLEKVSNLVRSLKLATNRNYTDQYAALFTKLEECIEDLEQAIDMERDEFGETRLRGL